MANRRLDLFGHDGDRIGLGDLISKAISTASRGRITECGGCKKRKETLNRVFSYKKKIRDAK